MQRRELLRSALALLAAPGSAFTGATNLPAEVAGVHLPRAPLAQRAAQFARARYPQYLFHHCMRTYLFGALLLAPRQRSYRSDEAFVAAALHDLGLLPAFASAERPFEIDSADAGERWTREHDGSAAQARRIWLAIELHASYATLARHAGPEALLVHLGAGADVIGVEPGTLDPHAIAEVVRAFPRLEFKRRFTQQLVEHCERKPDSQRRTWLEGLCRAHGAHPLPAAAVEHAIAAAAPFAE